MVIAGYLIKRRDVPALFNEFFHAAIEAYDNYKLFGFPHGGGWADQPAVLIDVIKIFKRVEADYGNKAQQSRGRGSSRHSRR